MAAELSAVNGAARGASVSLADLEKKYDRTNAVDGVSLTVASLAEGTFGVSLIPETLERTTLGRASPGDSVNLEVDVLAKYVERLVGATAR